MSRLIKFRAWDKTNNEWFMDGSTFDLNYSGRYGDFFFDNDHPANMRDVKLEWLQFTGLHDSDGVEIYEGDIIKFTYWWFDGNPCESELIGEVVYISESLSFGLRGVKNKEWIRHIGGNDGDSDTAPFAFWQFSEDDFHVIGNSKQNPELLP